jgi:hypothetical protein
MNRRLLAGLAAIALTWVVLPTVAAQEPQPTATIDSELVAVGDTLRIEGADWPPHVLATAVVCGNGALDGSVDCDLARSSTNAVTFDGILRLEVEVGEPPQPCPCVVRIFDTANIHLIEVPLEIEGVATQEPESRFSARGLASLEILSVEVRGSGPVPAWFGAAPERELVLTVGNNGDEALTGVSLLASWSSGDGTTRVFDAIDFPTVGTGSELVVPIPVSFDLMANGSYQVGGELVLNNDSITFATVTQMRPWGLFALGLTLAFVAIASLLVRWAIRSIRRRRATAAPIREAKVQAAILVEIEEQLLARLSIVEVDEMLPGLEEIVAIKVCEAVEAVARRFDLSSEESEALALKLSLELISEVTP